VNCYTSNARTIVSAKIRTFVSLIFLVLSGIITLLNTYCIFVKQTRLLVVSYFSTVLQKL